MCKELEKKTKERKNGLISEEVMRDGDELMMMRDGALEMKSFSIYRRLKRQKTLFQKAINQNRSKLN